MKKTIEKTTKKEERKEFDLQEAFVLWKKESKNKTAYLSGFTTFDDNKIQLVAYFNGLKKNPKEADIRVYSLNDEGKQDAEIASLWDNVSKNDKRYLTGTTDEKEKLVAFYGKENENLRPYIRAYFKKD